MRSSGTAPGACCGEQDFQGTMWVVCMDMCEGYLNLDQGWPAKASLREGTSEEGTKEASMPTMWLPGRRAFQAEAVEVQRP